MKWLKDMLWYAPTYFTRWRIFPRAFITMYLYILYQSVHWFMALPDPNTQQAGFVSVIIGTGAAWFGLYLQGPKFNAEEISYTNKQMNTETASSSENSVSFEN